MSITVRVDRAGMQRLLRGSSSPVASDLLVRGTRVQSAMRQLAPKASGDMANAVVKRPTTYAGRPAMLVGVATRKDAGKAVWMEEGTPAHKITARNRRALSFYSKRSGGRIVVKSVNHPGTRGYHWMTRALLRVLG